MINIYKELIKNNINKLTINQVKDFADKNNISYSDEEANIVFYYIKNYYDNILNGDINIIEEIKNKISPSLYDYLFELYLKYIKN